MLDRTRKGIKRLLRGVRLHGFTHRETASENLDNSKRALYSAFVQADSRGASATEMYATLRKTAKTRLRHTKNTIENILTVIRGRVRAILSGGCKRWVSVAMLDSQTTQICQSLAGKRYKMKYGDIPNKPPRTPPPHPCRSVLLPECNREKIKADTFKDWLKSEPEEVRKWLGPTRYRAWKSGELEINQFLDLKAHKLWTIEELHEKGKIDSLIK